MAAKLKLVQNAMSPAEACDAFDAFCREVGPKAEVYVSLQTRDSYVTTKRRAEALSASFYARGGYPEKVTLRVHGNTFEGLLAELRARWAEHAEQHVIDIIKAMALDVIRITDERGACTDADLRAGSFSHEDVARYGERACAKAGEMASKGPFSIITTSGSNFVGVWK